MQSEWLFCEENVTGIWTFNGKNPSIINKVKTFEMVVSIIVCQSSYSVESLGTAKGN